MIEGKPLTKKQLVRKCKSILKKDKYCVDNLPLDKDILDILVKTEVFRRKKRNTLHWSVLDIGSIFDDDYDEDDEDLEEPGLLSSESVCNEYGYKLAARNVLPDFVNSCIVIAADLQTLRNAENEAYYDNKKLDKERIELLTKIDSLRKERNDLYEEMGDSFDLSDEDVEKAIKDSDKALNLSDIPLGGINGLKNLAVGALGAAGLGTTAASSLGIGTSAFTAGLAGAAGATVGGVAVGTVLLPLAGILGTIGIHSYLSNRRKEYIMDGMIEAEEFFAKTLDKLRKSVKKPRIKALKAIKTIKGDIVGICADIEEANFIISQLQIEIAFIRDAIEVKEG